MNRGSTPTSSTKHNLKKGGLGLLVSEAAKKLGMNTQTLRLALQQDKFPFGEAIKTSEHRYTYYVNPTRLEKYLEGELI